MAVVPLAGDPDPLGALAVIHASSSDAFAPGELHALTTLAGLASVALANADLRHAQRNFFSHMTDLLVSALDAHLGYHGGHGTRVAQYANRIGREMRLDDSILQNLHFAAQLHDIGMLKFEQAMQKTPKACEKHAVIGARMLGQIRLWEGVAPIVLHHHEWMDGTGYPEGLAGDAIPFEARIVAVCDAFDSMTSSTSYKVAMSLEASVQELEEGAGTQFDPDVVRVFVDLAQRGVIEVLADASG
jgi:HD-GYP domain-containing protein (c-di-GMP phosphodiesterase class II)